MLPCIARVVFVTVLALLSACSQGDTGSVPSHTELDDLLHTDDTSVSVSNDILLSDVSTASDGSTRDQASAETGLAEVDSSVSLEDTMRLDVSHSQDLDEQGDAEAADDEGLSGDVNGDVADASIADATLDVKDDLGVVDAALEVFDEVVVVDLGPDYSAPRLIAPGSTSVLTGGLPIFEVALGTGADAALIELCADRSCDTVTDTLIAPRNASGHGVGVLTEVLDLGVHYWRARGSADGVAFTEFSPIWQLHVSSAHAGLTAVSGMHFDVELDGHVDALVGACGLSDCTSAVYVHRGGVDGLSAHPDATVDTPLESQFFGFSVSSAGDVDGDGYPEILVGGRPDLSVSGLLPGDESAYLMGNGPEGLEGPPSMIWTLPMAYFGFSVTGAGDVNRDGYADVAVGATFANVAYVYFGGPSGPGPIHSQSLGAPDLLGLGLSVAAAGDVNADGYADLLAGAPTNDKAVLFLGGAEGLGDPIVMTQADADNFGTSVNGAGDVDGDGYPDVVVGAPGGGGQAFVYRGSAAGLVLDLPIRLDADTSEFGIAVAAAGDVNADGYGDVLIGGQSQALIFLGGPEGPMSTERIIIDGATTAFGNAVRGVGDVDRNGYADVLIGATDAARAYLYLATETGLPAEASVVLSGPPESAGFGYTLAMRWPSRPPRMKTGW